MRIQYCSDLHLEFPENKEFFRLNTMNVEGDILVLTGDIVPFISLGDHNDFLDFVSENYKYTYWVPGNHEYYYDDISKRGISFTEKIRDNVFLVNNVSVVIDEVNFIFSTLWSKIDQEN